MRKVILSLTIVGIILVVSLIVIIVIFTRKKDNNNGPGPVPGPVPATSHDLDPAIISKKQKMNETRNKSKYNLKVGDAPTIPMKACEFKTVPFISADKSCARWCEDRGLGPPKYFLNHGNKPVSSAEYVNAGNSNPNTGGYFNAWSWIQSVWPWEKLNSAVDAAVCINKGDTRFTPAPTAEAQVGKNIGNAVGWTYIPDVNGTPTGIIFDKTSAQQYWNWIPETPFLCSACTHLNKPYNYNYMGNSLNNRTGICCCDTELGYDSGTKSSSPTKWNPGIATYTCDDTDYWNN